MDYDWFWVMLALGIFIPAGMVPLGNGARRLSLVARAAPRVP
jgi:hypothetical protein